MKPGKLFCAALLLFSCTVNAATDKPNIVLVFLDNFGWGEPGFNGGGIIRGAATPNMDQIAAEGLRLTNFNVEGATRSAAATARYRSARGSTAWCSGK
jgi:arylsulfatase